VQLGGSSALEDNIKEVLDKTLDATIRAIVLTVLNEALPSLATPLYNKKHDELKIMLSTRFDSLEIQFDKHDRKMSDLKAKVVKVEAMASADFQQTKTMAEDPTVKDLVDMLSKVEATARSPSPQHSISGYSTSGSAWPRCGTSSTHVGSPSFSRVPTSGSSPSPYNSSRSYGNASSKFHRATESTIVKVYVTSLVYFGILQEVISELMQKQFRKAGMASVNTFIVRFEGDRE